MTSTALLDLKEIPKLVGQDAQDRFFDIFSIVDKTHIPVYLGGPSGSGKTIMAMNVAKAYAKTHNVPAYYVQLSPDMTKTSLILGLRLIDGSLRAVDGVVAQAMRSGGVIVVDETTHATQELLLMLNSILDRTSVTSVGDEIVFATDTFRIIFASNFGYAGNVKLPPSFAQRMVAFDFGYPSEEDEIRIARSIVGEELGLNLTPGKDDDTTDLDNFPVPDKVMDYVVNLMREFRTDDIPLSVRNSASAIARFYLCPKADEVNTEDLMNAVTEPSARKIAERLNVNSVGSIDQLMKSDIKDVIEFAALVGVEEFREIVKSAFGYYLDIDGLDIQSSSWKNQMSIAII